MYGTYVKIFHVFFLLLTKIIWRKALNIFLETNSWLTQRIENKFAFEWSFLKLGVEDGKFRKLDTVQSPVSTFNLLMSARVDEAEKVLEQNGFFRWALTSDHLIILITDYGDYRFLLFVIFLVYIYVCVCCRPSIYKIIFLELNVRLFIPVFHFFNRILSCSNFVDFLKETGIITKSNSTYFKLRKF
jgi:hypothetical protein